MNCFVQAKSRFSHHWNGSAEAIFHDVGIGTEKETSRLHLFGHVGVDTERENIGLCIFHDVALTQRLITTSTLKSFNTSSISVAR